MKFWGRRRSVHDELDARLHRFYAEAAPEDWSSHVAARTWSRVATNTRLAPSRAPAIWGTWQWPRRFAVVAAALTLATGASLAANGVINPGKPTNDVPSGYFRLSGFHRAQGGVLRSHGKITLLAIGSQLIDDQRSAEERWVVVKSLDQFGFLTGLRPIERSCARANRQYMTKVCTIPSIDWTHAGYRSKFVNFVHVDLLKANGAPLQHMTAWQRALYDRYARADGKNRADPDNVRATIANAGTDRTLPLLAVGGYVQTVSQTVLVGDFQHYVDVQVGEFQYDATPSGLSFSTVSRALASGLNPGKTTLIHDVNAEANAMTALVCHADGHKPASVCGRTAVKSLEKLIH